MIVLTAHVTNIQFEISGSLLALVNFSDVGHLDLTHLAWPLQEGTTDTNVRLYCSKTQK